MKIWAVKIPLLAMPFWFAGLSLLTPPLQAAELPHIQMVNGTGQLIVNGHPFLILGGELGNSSSATAAQADAIVLKLATMDVNTILMPVAWEQLEPKEGNFDFSILDHWMETARAHKAHLVLLWFGSWKNAFSNYAPSWVKSDPQRFPRAESADGRPLEILSTLSPATRRCDSRAFAALLRRVREKDSEQQTVLMVQVENEVGYLGQGRDRSPEANRQFRARPRRIAPRSRCKARATLPRTRVPLQRARANLGQSFWRCRKRSLHGLELRELYRSRHSGRKK